MSRCTVTVHVAGRMFSPGDVVPEKYARLMGAHCFEGHVHPYPPPVRVPDAVVTPPRRAAASPVVPPRAGPGSSKAAWAAYAAAHGVQVEPGLSRDDTIAALDAAGIPTE